MLIKFRDARISATGFTGDLWLSELEGMGPGSGPPPYHKKPKKLKETLAVTLRMHRRAWDQPK